MTRTLAVAVLGLVFVVGLPAAAPDDSGSSLAGTEGIERVRALIELASDNQVNDPAKALEYAEQARVLAERIGDDDGLCQALNKLGIGHYFLANYGEALKYYSASLEIAETLPDPERAPNALNNIGILYYMWGDYDQALEYYSRALELRLDNGDPRGLAVAHNNLGNVYYAAGRHEESLAYYKEALAIYRESGDTRWVASTLNNIGLSLYELDNFDEALLRFEEALVIGETLSDKPGLAFTLNNLGLVHGSLNRYSLAIDFHRRALAVREQIGDRQGRATCHHNLGETYAALGEYDRALQELGQALALAEEIEVKEIQRDVHLTLSETHEKTGDHAKALEHYRRYKAVNDELFDEETGRRLAERQARYEVESKDREIEILRKNQQVQRLVRNVAIGGAVLLVLVLLLLYNRYRLKERAAAEMEKANDALRVAQIERERAARAELTHVSRVAVMGELATTLAHELNQPLTAIMSNAQATRRLAARPERDADEIDDALVDIVAGAGRARDLIRRLRDLVKRREITPESLDVNKVVSDVESIVRAETEQGGIELVFDLGDDLPTVTGDRIQIQQVLINLVHNAAEAMRTTAGDKRIVVRTEGRDGGAGILVSDTGPGADESTIHDMLRPFYTTKEEGLGMGLPICRSIAEAHGGVLAIERNTRPGLTVSFTIPTRPEAEVSAG